MPYDTLEKAQARIVELDEQIHTMNQEMGTLSENNKTLTAEKEELRTLNQKYFNKLIAQEKNDPEPEPESDTKSCEEFAEEMFKKGDF